MKSDQIAIIATISVLTIIFLVLELRKKSSTNVKLSSKPSFEKSRYCTNLCGGVFGSCWPTCMSNEM